MNWSVHVCRVPKILQLVSNIIGKFHSSRGKNGNIGNASPAEELFYLSSTGFSWMPIIIFYCRLQSNCIDLHNNGWERMHCNCNELWSFTLHNWWIGCCPGIPFLGIPFHCKSESEGRDYIHDSLIVTWRSLRTISDLDQDDKSINICVAEYVISLLTPAASFDWIDKFIGWKISPTKTDDEKKMGNTSCMVIAGHL